MAHSQAENDAAIREEETIFLPDLFDADTNLHSLHRLPKQSTDYATAGYWENRYTHEDGLVYDWYGVDYSDFRTSLLKWAGIGPRTVLEIGSGNSEWSDRMAADGLFVTSTDISSLVLENMAARLQPEASGAVERVCADVCRLPFREELFDFVVDKGTMDALSCFQGSLSDSSSFMGDKAMAAKETTTSTMHTDEAELHGVVAPLKLLSAAWSVWKALKVGGCWFVLTAKAPETLLRAMGFGDAVTQTPSFEVQHGYLSNGTFLVSFIKKGESNSLGENKAPPWPCAS